MTFSIVCVHDSAPKLFGGQRAQSVLIWVVRRVVGLIVGRVVRLLIPHSPQPRPEQFITLR